MRLANFFASPFKCGSTTEWSLSSTVYNNKQLCFSTGIVHSDLKPANFILAGGVVKLIDFGIAKTIQPDRTSITCDQIVGTFSYMSPEAISDLNGGADLFGDNKPNIKVLSVFMFAMCKVHLCWVVNFTYLFYVVIFDPVVIFHHVEYYSYFGQRSPNKIMISKTADLNNRDFVVHMLYRDCCTALC